MCKAWCCIRKRFDSSCTHESRHDFSQRWWYLTHRIRSQNDTSLHRVVSRNVTAWIHYSYRDISWKCQRNTSTTTHTKQIECLLRCSFLSCTYLPLLHTHKRKHVSHSCYASRLHSTCLMMYCTTPGVYINGHSICVRPFCVLENGEYQNVTPAKLIY